MDEKSLKKIKESEYFEFCQRVKGFNERGVYNPIARLQREKLAQMLKNLKKKMYVKVGELEAKAYVRSEPVPFSERKKGNLADISKYYPWSSDVFDCGWFNFTGVVPEKASGKKIVAVIDISGEGLVVDDNGNAVLGITTFSSDFDNHYGNPEKKYVPLFDSAVVGEKIDFWVDASANDLFGRLPNEGAVVQKDIAYVNENIKTLYYDLWVLLSWFDNTSEKETYKILSIINKLAPKIRKVTEETAPQISEELKPLYDMKNEGEVLELKATGHAHLDLAWLWPLRESHRKGARTFSTQLAFMDKYPEYSFGASQAQLYTWVEKEYPELFEKVAKRIEEGRWEVQGSTWVEPDSNLTSGESLFRQFIYGKKYFSEKFNKEGKVFFIPDSFGYTGCLPQIMKLCGVDYFLTQKMSWNTVNKFPYHTFTWVGIDGSSVLSHMLPENTYNSPMRPDMLKLANENYTAKPYCKKALSLFGIGDGGAGPSEDHIERLTRMKNLKYLPKVSYGMSTDFFKEIEKNVDEYPVYEGELYLERHRGTYTSQSENKRYNRKTELLLREYESLAARLDNPPIPAEELEEIWKEALLYQFHDILPGSSIKRVYDETSQRYPVIIERLKKGISEATAKIFGKDTVYNSLNWDREYVFIKDEKAYVLNIPAFSSAKTSEAKEIEAEVVADENLLENELIKVVFDKDGNIVSYFDKQNNFEYIPSGALANKFTLYEDKGDCWDILPWDYKPADKAFQPVRTKVEVIKGKGYASIKSYYEVCYSTMEQTVTLYAGKNSLVFDTFVDYKETKKMLRVAFPLNMKSEVCKFNLQYGHISRRTTEDNSVEKAQFEVSGQKFVDYSDGEHGMALINDSKYGFRCKNNVVDMNLLRSAMFPGKDADKGEHRFFYELCPHAGELGSDIYRKAYEFNVEPSFAADIEQENSKAFGVNIDNENIIVDYVKPSFDGQRTVVRIFNSAETEQKAAVDFGKEAFIVDAITEQNVCAFEKETTFRPFEVKIIAL